MNLQIKNEYYFTMLAPMVLSTGYRATVKAILDYSVASMIQPELVDTHAEVYPYVLAGTPLAADKLNYILVRTQTGEDRVIAYEWLAAPPTPVSAGTVTVVMSNASNEDVQVLSDLVRANFDLPFTVSFT
jgi:hypothetical protein